MFFLPFFRKNELFFGQLRFRELLTQRFHRLRVGLSRGSNIFVILLDEIREAILRAADVVSDVFDADVVRRFDDFSVDDEFEPPATHSAAFLVDVERFRMTTDLHKMV